MTLDTDTIMRVLRDMELECDGGQFNNLVYRSHFEALKEIVPTVYQRHQAQWNHIDHFVLRYDIYSKQYLLDTNCGAVKFEKELTEAEARRLVSQAGEPLTCTGVPLSQAGEIQKLLV